MFITLNIFDKIKNLLVIDVGPDEHIFQLVTCYSPPSEQIPLDVFDQIINRNCNSIITGDFNAKHSNWSNSLENQKGQKLFKWLSLRQSRSPFNIINKHIRTSTRSNAAIDLIIAPSDMSCNSFSTLPSIGNDHHPVIWHSPLHMTTNHLTHPIKCTRWNLFKVFLTFVASYWQSLASAMEYSDDYFSLYERFLSLGACRLTSVSYQKTLKPSLPPELVILIKQKQQVLTLFRKTRHPYLAVLLRDMSKASHKQLFEHRRNSWLKYCKSFNEGDVKAFWTKTKHHFKNKAVPIEGFINGNGNAITDPADMCTAARNFYEEQFSNHQSTYSNIETEADELDRRLENDLQSLPPTPIQITFEHLRRSIKTLKNKSSSGLDGVSNKILKPLPLNHLSTILSCMNNFAHTILTPANWHIARIILLSKTKSKTVRINETRPISLLSCFSKLFEKCFMIQFRQWIYEQGILSEEQSGFRPGHNMAVRLVAMVDQIGQSLTKNTAAAALFVDFRTAFNQLWFNGLWLKLNNLHCPLHFVAWLRHYLRGRRAYIDMKNTSSNLFNLSKGVPQGSCIGPLLFIVFHYDILEAL